MDIACRSARFLAMGQRSGVTVVHSAWRVIDCSDFEGRLSYERGRMMVIPRAADGSEAGPAEVPLAQTAVLLLGLKAVCSTALLFELAQNGVSVLLCDWRGVPVGAMESWSETATVVATRHRAQAAMSLPRQKNAWKRIVKAKIRGQAHCLDLCGRPGGELLQNLAKTVQSGDPSNVEGHAAREYWQRIFPAEEEFQRKPGSGTPRNSQLDYAYTVLRGFVIRAVLTAGLDPTFGVNHHNRSNYFCLADDLIEPYRSAVDVKIAQLSDNDSVSDKDVKRFLVDAVNAQFGESGLTIPSSLNSFAQQYGLYCEGKRDVLPVPVFGGDDGED